MSMMSTVPLSLMYRSDQHMSQLFDNLRELYIQEEMCDTVLSVGTCHIKAHRAVLAAFSPYFRTALRQESSPLSRGFMIHILPNLKEDIVKLLINFCYAGEIMVDSHSAEDMLIAARCLQVQEVEKLCVTFLAAQRSLKVETTSVRTAAQRPCSIFTAGLQPHSPSPPQAVQRGHNSAEPSHTEPLATTSSPTVQSTSVTSGHGASSPQDTADVEIISIKSEPFEVSDESGLGPDSINHIEMGKFVSKYAAHSGVRYSGIHSPLQLSPGNPNLFMSPPVLTMSRSGLLVPHPVMAGQAGCTFPEIAASQSRGSTIGSNQSMKSHLVSSQPMKCGPLSCQSYSHQTVDADLSSPVEQTSCSPVAVPLPQSMHYGEHLSDSETLKAHNTVHRQQHRDVAPKPRRLYSNASFRSEQEGSKTFMCNTCGKCFKNLQALKFHRYNHVLRYSCSFCGKRFSRSFNMQRHRKTHFKERLWQGMAHMAAGFESSEMDIPEGFTSEMDLEEKEEPSEIIDEEEENVAPSVADDDRQNSATVSEAESQIDTIPAESYQNTPSEDSP